MYDVNLQITHSFTDRLARLLRDFKYKPGWGFRIVEGRMLLMEVTTIDADDHDKTFKVTFSTGIPAHVPYGYPVDRWLFEEIVRVERHEVREFFQVRGVKVFDPHAGEKR